MKFLRKWFPPKLEPELGQTARELLSLLDRDDWRLTDEGLQYAPPTGPLGPTLKRLGWEGERYVSVDGKSLFSTMHEYSVLWDRIKKKERELEVAWQEGMRRKISGLAAGLTTNV